MWDERSCDSYSNLPWKASFSLSSSSLSFFLSFPSSSSFSSSSLSFLFFSLHLYIFFDFTFLEVMSFSLFFSHGIVLVWWFVSVRVEGGMSVLIEKITYENNVREKIMYGKITRKLWESDVDNWVRGCVDTLSALRAMGTMILLSMIWFMRHTHCDLFVNIPLISVTFRRFLFHRKVEEYGKMFNISLFIHSLFSVQCGSMYVRTFVSIIPIRSNREQRYITL